MLQEPDMIFIWSLKLSAGRNSHTEAEYRSTIMGPHYWTDWSIRFSFRSSSLPRDGDRTQAKGIHSTESMEVNVILRNGWAMKSLTFIPSYSKSFSTHRFQIGERSSDEISFSGNMLYNLAQQASLQPPMPWSPLKVTVYVNSALL